jgi:hypothetical protein
MSKLTFEPVIGGPKPKSVLEYEKALKEGLDSLTPKQKENLNKYDVFTQEATDKLNQAYLEGKTIKLSLKELFGK